MAAVGAKRAFQGETNCGINYLVLETPEKAGFVLGQEVSPDVMGPTGDVRPLLWPVWLAAVWWIEWMVWRFSLSPRSFHSLWLCSKCHVPTACVWAPPSCMSLSSLCVASSCHILSMCCREGGSCRSLDETVSVQSALVSESPSTEEKSLSHPGRQKGQILQATVTFIQELPLRTADF